MTTEGRSLLFSADGALYLVPDADLQARRLDRAEVAALIAGFRKNLGHTTEFAELSRALEGTGAETQAGGRQVALLIAALASMSASAVADPRGSSGQGAVAAPGAASAHVARPDYGALGEEVPVADRTVRVRNVTVTRRYRDGAGVVHTAAPGRAFVQVRYQERNLGRETIDTCTLRQLNFGGDQHADPLGHHFEEAEVFIRNGESFGVRTTFEVPLSALGHNAMLYFVRPVDPTGGSDVTSATVLASQGHAIRVLVALPPEAT